MRRPCWAKALALWLLCGEPCARAATFELASDQKSTVTGAELCLGVDHSRPFAPDRGAQVVPASGGKPFPISGTFYPVVSVRCDAPRAEIASKWTFTNTRELRIAAGGAPLCLSARFMTSFAPLAEPYLSALGAREPGSSLAYLVSDLKPNGDIDTARLRKRPELVVSSCGRPDAVDFWVYDDSLGTISGPAGWDDQGPRARHCVTLHGDGSLHPPKYDAGQPVFVSDCPDLRSFDRASAPAHQRWRMSAGREALPVYRPAKPGDYFGGADGLPISLLCNFERVRHPARGRRGGPTRTRGRCRR